MAKWIQGAIRSKHKGKLRSWAKRHRLLNEDGTIDLRRARAKAERDHDLTRIREVNLAMNLRRLGK